MRKLYNVAKQNSITGAAKRMSLENNVIINVIDRDTNKIVQTHESHNAATNSLLTGIAHYLIGDGSLNQAKDMLSQYLPRYISLGTMGLFTQAADSQGLPIGLGFDSDTTEIDQTNRLCHYMSQCPGFGADGYDENENNERPYLGLGPVYADKPFEETVSCELISDTYPRAPISFRDIVPESSAEVPKTIDVIYSALISVGALAQFRDEDAEYLFITEAGLWSKRTWSDGGDNGLLAGYRIMPSSHDNWNMGTYVEGHEDPDTGEWISPHYELSTEIDDDGIPIRDKQLANQKLLRENIIRVNKNQIVQVIWKIQLGGLEQLGSIKELYPEMDTDFIWHIWDSAESFHQYGSIELFPSPGISGHVYQDLSTNITYKWDSETRQYVRIQK